jgi:hypothetical protein
MFKQVFGCQQAIEIAAAVLDFDPAEYRSLFIRDLYLGRYEKITCVRKAMRRRSQNPKDTPCLLPP